MWNYQNLITWQSDGSISLKIFTHIGTLIFNNGIVPRIFHHSLTFSQAVKSLITLKFHLYLGFKSNALTCWFFRFPLASWSKLILVFCQVWCQEFETLTDYWNEILSYFIKIIILKNQSLIKYFFYPYVCTSIKLG